MCLAGMKEDPGRDDLRTLPEALIVVTPTMRRTLIRIAEGLYSRPRSSAGRKKHDRMIRALIAAGLVNRIEAKSITPAIATPADVRVLCLTQAGRDFLIRVIRARRARSPQPCRQCGCTDERACTGGCWWISPSMCSRCAEANSEAKLARIERGWT